ncbi:cytochrome [Arthrobacter jiangjiafuii]|uniref:Cytochrome n=1 Tax=Arthrobacter jiangjiafuii TaxID=2817475 RepID=A0A975R1J3_9MICC|nr:PD-(D/E)XK nuclease family protein [Arthrobacter jiangjiafuii]MBP3044397.1 cytochrome [Arthrobacter jiangjiafuii]QWC11342.1 cytochrome [Arthrobacter jiangjiafuii]
MTDPALAHATEFGRMYSRSLSTPPSVPSITTVIAQGSTSLDGWHSHMAATAVAKDPKLAASLGNPGAMRSIVKEASRASERYRDQAAERGTRVHHYCEQVSLRALDLPHQLEAARTALQEHGEHQFADRFDEWWDLYQVEPLAPEITVWNDEVGYAGTLDLVARINGRLCLIDYKTKNTDRDGQVKPLDDKVVMQLVAGMKAKESLVDAGNGVWEPWAYGEDPLLLGVAVGQTEVRPMRANPAVLPQHWFKFCALRRLWQTSYDVAAAGRALLPIAPPAVGSHAVRAPQASVS